MSPSVNVSLALDHDSQPPMLYGEVDKINSHAFYLLLQEAFSVASLAPFLARFQAIKR